MPTLSLPLLKQISSNSKPGVALFLNRTGKRFLLLSSQNILETVLTQVDLLITGKSPNTLFQRDFHQGKLTIEILDIEFDKAERDLLVQRYFKKMSKNRLKVHFPMRYVKYDLKVRFINDHLVVFYSNKSRNNIVLGIFSKKSEMDEFLKLVDNFQSVCANNLETRRYYLDSYFKSEFNLTRN